MGELRETDHELLVTVRLYGGGTAEDAAQALRDYRSTFDLDGDREVEIIGVTIRDGQDAPA